MARTNSRWGIRPGLHKGRQRSMSHESSVPRKARDSWGRAKWLKRVFLLLKAIYLFFNQWLLKPLLGLVILILFTSKIATRIVGPPQYTLYVVGDFSRPAAQSIFSAFKKKESLQLDEINVNTKYKDDHGDPEEAKRIAEELARGNDTLLVIGHITGSQTKLALPYYLGVKPPVPVILAVETTPNLAPPKGGRTSYDPIFRLSPTDDRQASSIAQFISQHQVHSGQDGVQAVWVIEDSSNALSSDYLARAFVHEAQKQRINVVLRSTNLSPPTAQAIRDLHIRWVFFAGRRENALILIQQLQSMDPLSPAPSIVLSDASANEFLTRSLSKPLGSDPSGVCDSSTAPHFKNLKAVYVASQVGAKEYQIEAERSKHLAEEADAPAGYKQDAGYSIYGPRAVTVVRLLFARADDAVRSSTSGLGSSCRVLRWIGVHRVRCARALLTATMQASQGAPFYARRRHRD
jgi:Periplasmic binding protein